MSKAPISVFVLTLNEEANIENCLKSLTPFAGEIHIIDSFSTDRTLDLAKHYGAQIWQHKFTTFGAQRNWALEEVPFEYPWLFTLDADHRVSPELWQELLEVLPKTSDNVAGYFVRRHQFFKGRHLRFGAQTKYMLKIFRKEGARFDEEELDDRVYVRGETRLLNHHISEDNANENAIGFWIEKHNRYATKLAQEELKIRRGQKKFFLKPNFWGNPNERILSLKLRWYRLPLLVRPFLYFSYRYFFRLGILDGKEGFYFHFLQAFWFRLLVDIKLEEALEAPKPENVLSFPSSRKPQRVDSSKV
jgi:glycosyltransferase involved in cell wall biosynthesis